MKLLLPGSLLGVSLLAATLLNGAGPYLKRIGAIETDKYEAYWAIHCGDVGTTREPFGLGRRCSAPNKGASPRDVYAYERPYRRHVHETTDYELALKLPKDLLMAALAGLFLFEGVRNGGLRGVSRTPWPATALLGLVAASALVTGLRQGPWPVAAGLRSFTCVAIGVFGALVRPYRLDQVAGALAVLLFGQLALGAPELLYGMPLYGHLPILMLPERLAGTLVLPNSLGVFVVAALAFIVAFGRDRRLLPGLFMTTLVLVLAAGSASGLLALLALTGTLAVQRVAPSWRASVSVGLVVLLLLLVAALPAVLSRPDVFDSILSPTGRLARLKEGLATPWLQRLVGSGIGEGTNTSINLAGRVPSMEGEANAELPQSDSTVTLLVRQIGILGAALFYGSLAWAWGQDRRARPFYLVIGLTSLTMNVTELFPVNALLGLALAQSLSASQRWAGSTPRAH